ncbi:tetraacyldisaccharide-1-P 4'-kinase [Saprolegnia parasitica CBS 223.65]|uniref:tetraacyldisaccharide 4'-kinase n=1 Tax=Saprolegnia parasitica (strain CBS 223.65) TaxID=695850 RepID=A0A067CQA4_SAPPC|nr:tetraacyldisaccharide-1-P 4'-kinase [Saprolegnia parasitica CBS 223.65]KDO29007.1 tetraacyldisaccharide-1-P 4'-kinase [Saprolegnia parasitica CBS 223.65]|eukprot:XP_012200336.1 tetraacyldisaccharide-1-P 4'-kinase [Saprolegnia parasitica CBS 223.65]
MARTQWQRDLRRAVWRQLMLDRHEQHPLVQGALSSLSALYGSLSALRRTYYASQPRQRLPLRTISFGNVTWGGTGKTPCLHHVARYLAGRDVPFMLVSRGYGDDEWKMFAAEFPESALALGAHRYEAAMKQICAHSSKKAAIALVDDGLQQYSLQKDLEIVMLDAYNPFGNGALLPQGRLRERPEVALPRADIVILHHADHLQPTEVAALTTRIRPWLRPDAVVATTRMEITALPLVSEAAACVQTRVAPPLATKDTALVVGLCGIGCPASFQDALRKVFPASALHMEIFPDHHAYTTEDLQSVASAIETHRDGRDVLVVTTEKDFFRAPGLLQASLGADYELRVALSQLTFIQERDAVFAHIDKLLATPFEA